jgi:DNA polymerase-3 subunit gamma/tau
MMQLCEKYRPRTWEQFIGQPKIVARVRAMVERADFGDGSGAAFLFSGPTGTGKTTLAQIISRAVGVYPGPAWNYIELDGDKCNAETVRALDDRASRCTLFDGAWKVFIVNEFHAMTSKAVQAWLTLLERLPARWLVVFTTTEKLDADLFGNFTAPFASRCTVFQFTNQALCEVFAARAREIATAEGLNGQPIERYVKLVKKHQNSMRAVLQAIDAGEMIDP